MLAKILAIPRIRDWLIKRAMATPYLHIMSEDRTDVYMYRYWLFNPYDKYNKARWPLLPSIRLHRIMVPDGDRHMRDHPWNATTRILDGWYDEERRVLLEPAPYSWEDDYINVNYRRMAGATAKLRFGEYHRITAVSPGGVWTLFSMGKFRGPWGFNVDGRKVVHWRYLRRTAAVLGYGDDKACPITFQGDQEVCTECGMRWDANDPAPPECPLDDVKE